MAVLIGNPKSPCCGVGLVKRGCCSVICSKCKKVVNLAQFTKELKAT